VQIPIADPQESYRKALNGWLSKHGYSVLAAANGREALTFMEENPSIDVALLEIRLPDMGGMEVLAAISKWLHHPQVIMMTTIEDGVIADHARHLGAFDYLVKPVKMRSLEQSIVACLAHAEYQRQHWWRRLTRLA
jgi:DNA-binding NtrC family response regulator